MHPALPAVSQDELGPQLHLLLSSFFDWLKPAHSSMQYIGQVTSHRSYPMQVTASRLDLREVRRITEEEGEVKVCHVIIKCLVSTLVLPVCHWSSTERTTAAPTHSLAKQTRAVIIREMVASWLFAYLSLGQVSFGRKLPKQHLPWPHACNARCTRQAE